MNDGRKLESSITGMTDTELETACRVDSKGASIWHNWTSEIYSFGKCFRYMASYPDIFPLFVGADHGVGLEANLYVNELDSNVKTYFTWHPIKERRYKSIKKPQVIQIPHPWIFYRKALTITRSDKLKGTLVFFTHQTLGVKWEGHDTEEYFAQLRKLPDKFQPVVLCLHMHDVNTGLHKELRSHGFPIVTAGNTSSINFVDRFYNLIKDYSYATSQVWGSQVAYCVELGIPYFFLGEKPELINICDKNFPIGLVPEYRDDYHRDYLIQAHMLFNEPVDNVTDEQCEFIESLLGIDSRITSRQVSLILWREFFRHWRQWPVMFRPFVSWLLRKLGLYGVLQKLLKKPSKNQR